MSPPVSLHQRIRGDLEALILSGDWAPGQRVPAEHELMASYGCSRMTVNKVLTELASRGLVERRRRAGTFVARPRPPSALLQIPDVQADILALGHAYGLRLLEREQRESNAEDKARLGVDTPRPVLAIRCLHQADGRPFALEDRLIDLSTVPMAARESFEDEPPGTWLLHHVPWSEAEHRIWALNTDPQTARLLDLPAGAACLALGRQTWRNGAPVTEATTVYPAGGYQLAARFQPGHSRENA
ncbi:HTH-type transcriptional repressor YvoA [Hartmannibacter diazotrophicus]|uniref:Histidine utilization repressor n=1 Tax=Hartmannibacter diazotrophicus TaxID=1482074 RepID=A0A2C9D0G0_9HYPH|nr:histidine utilization repressor [Hartmannibacter diazotrophicus]SON53750.1 HTH-type transcriptional repressor YvoA [Hartmannibacter diazotrophicus]